MTSPLPTRLTDDELAAVVTHLGEHGDLDHITDEAIAAMAAELHRLRTAAGPPAALIAVRRKPFVASHGPEWDRDAVVVFPDDTIEIERLRRIGCDLLPLYADSDRTLNAITPEVAKWVPDKAAGTWP